ncbi:MAG: hypothetical protein ACP5P1_02365 [Acidimicrobiales bacterium]
MASLRSRLLLKLIGLVVTLVITVITMRSFSLSPSSPLAPAKVVGNAVNGLCADSRAISEADGQDSGPAASVIEGAGPTVGSPLGASSALTPLVSAAGLTPGELSCATATPPPASPVVSSSG